MDGTIQGGLAECLGCHASKQPSSGDQRYIIVGAAAAADEGGDFIRNSRHVKNATVMNLDCVVCHSEGDVSSTEAAPVRHATLHGDGTVDLRNVDANTSVAAAWPGYRDPAVTDTITSTDRDNMDTFCMNCHDSNGSSDISVNATDDGITTGGSARNTTPFNTSDGGSPMDVKGQFNSGDLVGRNYASHHQLNQFEPRYKNGYQTTAGYGLNRGGWTGTSNDGVAYNWETTLHCGDCHLNESNAHGSVNTLRMMQTMSGDDSTWTNNGTGTGTFVCYKCHDRAVYHYGSTDSTKPRITHGTMETNAWSGAYTGGDAGRAIYCLNCHGGNSVGSIHGNNRSITTQSSYSTKSYRFAFGAELGIDMTDAAWEDTSTVACYTAGTTWGGSCTKHDSGTSTGRIDSPNYSRDLDSP
jgi:hypothetical protein